VEPQKQAKGLSEIAMLPQQTSMFPMVKRLMLLPIQVEKWQQKKSPMEQAEDQKGMENSSVLPV